MVFVISVCLSGLMIDGICRAYGVSRFRGKEAECLAKSAGRADILAVQYACERAARTAGNGCSLWLGDAGTAALPVIYADSPTGTVAASFWGMCTDYSDTTRKITVKNDGGSIDAGMNLTRGLWPDRGFPSAVGTTIDIAKFIAGADKQKLDECYTKYHRRVIIGRHNGETGDYHEMPEDVYLVVPEEEDCAKKPEKNVCERWTPPGYNDNLEPTIERTTTIDVRVKDMSPRFGGTGFGDWNEANTKANPIYIMPTDEVRWVMCYYGGTAGTADVKVATLNGEKVGEYEDLSEDECQVKSAKPDLIDPNAINKLELYEDANKLKTAVEDKYTDEYWENYWQANEGDGEIINPGDIMGDGSTPPFEFPEDENADGEDTEKFNGKKTELHIAGSIYFQKAKHGRPYSVKITKVDKETNPENVACCYTDKDTGELLQINPDTGKEEACKELATDEDCGCTNTYDDDFREAEVEFEHPDPELDGGTPGVVLENENAAFVKVPYNYENYISVNLAQRDDYSGEYTITVSDVSSVTVPRYNSVTQATYATESPKSKAALWAYVVTKDQLDSFDIGGAMGEGNVCDAVSYHWQCTKLADYDETELNPTGSLSGATYTWASDVNYNSFDASAGDYMCFVATVFPAAVDGDTQMVPGGNGKWRYSGPDCRIIAKRPTFQVWGDGLYSVSDVKGAVGKKYNIYTRPGGYIPQGGSEIYFGSWVEGILNIKTGTTDSVASGAATGINPGNAAGAGNSGDFLTARSPLSISNTGGSVGKSQIPEINWDMGEDLIKYWAGGRKKGNCSALGLSGEKIESATGKTICYVNSGGTTSGETVSQGTTYLIEGGAVNIAGNIVYTNDDYKRVEQIPKVVISADTINIKCGVTEVDAILLAKEVVRTCADKKDEGDGESQWEGVPTYNNDARQNKLKIFGTVITKKINLGRTYGAAANGGGMVDLYSNMTSDGAAAEVFDYDPTILLWGEFMSGSQESDTLQTVYQHELAPRY